MSVSSSIMDDHDNLKEELRDLQKFPGSVTTNMLLFVIAKILLALLKAKARTS